LFAGDGLGSARTGAVRAGSTNASEGRSKHTDHSVPHGVQQIVSKCNGIKHIRSVNGVGAGDGRQKWSRSVHRPRRQRSEDYSPSPDSALRA
jgi:hypothetical protein